MKVDNRNLGKALSYNVRAFRMWHRQYPGIFLSSVLYEVVKGVIPCVGIYLSAQIINELAGMRDTIVIWRLVWITLIVEALLSLFRAILSAWKEQKHAGLYYKMKKFYTDKMLQMDFSVMDDTETHALYSQVMQNENWSNWGMGRIVGYFESSVGAVIQIVGAIVLTVSLFTQKVPEQAGSFVILNHPLFMLVIVGSMVLVSLIIPACSNKANRYWVKQSEEAKQGNRLFGFFMGMLEEHYRAQDIRIYEQGQLCDDYMKNMKAFTPASEMAGYARGPMGLYQALGAGMSTVLTGMVYVFVCLKSWAGAFGVGSVTQYVGAVTALSTGVASLITTVGDMCCNAEFLKVTFRFLDMPNKMYKGSLTTEKRNDRKYEVEFQNVSFRYPSSETYALRHVSMKFEIGRRLAVVGQNGSGKTTFIKLLCRLYDTEEGRILLNGIDIRKYNYRDYMNLFSVVFQDFQLLAFPLGENVAAKMDYEEAEVIRCLKAAGFGRRLEELKDGVGTYLYKEFDENGVEISGGEAQKVALARALYKDAPFMILDEPTAALDPVAEYEVYSRFDEIVGDRTAVYISHRLSSCRFCNEILVFDKGKIVQQGNHDRLVKETQGKYYELWYAQAQYYMEST